MNRRALFYGLAYAAFYILFKLAILLGGWSLTRFGYFYSNVTVAVLIAPFYWACVRQARDRDFGGVISGQQGMRLCLTIFAVAAIVTFAYNYAEYEFSGKQLAIEYYNGDQFRDFLRTRKEIKTEDYDRIIHEQVESAGNAAFRASTGKLFSLLIIGLVTAFAVSSALKRRQAV